MFKPVNRYIQVKLPEVVPQTTSGIVLPDDFKPKEERYGAAEVVSYATDVRFKEQIASGVSVIVDKSMIEEITINNSKINVILDNYVVGIISK
jgi:co-chaperonin GroES (HSP10)